MAAGLQFNGVAMGYPGPVAMVVFLPNSIIWGGGWVGFDLSRDVRRGDNTLAVEGGFRIWHDRNIVV